ncbi:Dyp-type peroxidase [soil metagenome]
MPIDLTNPLRWSSAQGDDLAMLDDLQGNILDGHGRKATLNIFLSFGPDSPACRTFVHWLETQIMSAHTQLKQAEIFRRDKIPGSPFVGLLLSAKGYDAVERADAKPVVDDGGAFENGMRSRAEALNDPPVKALELAYRDDLHAMILVGADPDSPDGWESVARDNVGTMILNRLQLCAKVVKIEKGRAIFRANAGSTEDTQTKREGIEHFGYVDGRSQPLMLKELVQREADESDGITIWNPEFPIGPVLIADPGAPVETRNTAFGSFFVFRKLEQDVRAFKKAEEEIGKTLGLGELAGAMLVGRFEDGTPAVLQREDGGDNPVMNNFNYAGDPDGLRCPIHAHIRKTNPRGESVRPGLAGTVDEERSHIMGRRGMTYGRRNHVLNPSDEPSGDVGLMFMAFRSNIANQFEFTQRFWANNANFVEPGTGIDPLRSNRRSYAATDQDVRSLGLARA